jgi:DNA-binding MarR family transcriptional regulator
MCKVCAMHENLILGLVEVIGFINDPRRDGRLLAEAGVDFEPVLLPLLVRLGVGGSAGVVELAAQLGRDHSTMSRQLAKLEKLGLAQRSAAPNDRRSRITRLTARGDEAVAALSAARSRVLDQALADWSPADRGALAWLLRRFAGALKATADAAP